jgi:hypothetical protein
MNNLKKFILISLVIGLAVGVYTWFFVYNKPHADYAQMEAVAEMTAETCYSAFANSDTIAQSWLGQVIQVSGTVSLLEQVDSTWIYVMVVNPDGMFGPEGIRCSMKIDAQDWGMQEYPADLSIKGYCTGFNETDVILEQCIIVN